MKKYLAFFFVVFIGCKPIEPVEFDEIKNVQLDNLADNKIKISDAKGPRGRGPTRRPPKASQNPRLGSLIFQ